MSSSKTFWHRWKSRSDTLLSFSPTPKLALWTLTGGVGALWLSVFGATAALGWSAFAAAALAVLSLWDLRLLGRHTEMTALRHSERLEEGQEATVSLAVTIVTFHAQRPQTIWKQVEIRDTIPAILHCTQETLVQEPADADGVRFLLSMRVRPQKRGDAAFGDTFVRLTGQLGLWRRIQRVTVEQTTPVWPDTRLTSAKRAALAKALARDGDILVRAGQGLTEFDHVRDFAQGDDPRHVNWFASARQHRLMRNVYRPERGQHVILALDCGRTMGVQQTVDKSRLDLALEAALLTAQAALDAGDDVSLIAFSDRVLLHLAHQKGKSGLRALTEAVYNLEARPVYTGSHLLTELVFTHHKKRSLLIYFSDLADLAHQDLFARDIAILERRHACVVTSFTDEALLDTAHRHPSRLREAATTAAAAALLTERRVCKERLGLRGVTVIESREDVFTGALHAYARFKQAPAASGLVKAFQSSGEQPLLP